LHRTGRGAPLGNRDLSVLVVRTRSEHMVSDVTNGGLLDRVRSWDLRRNVVYLALPLLVLILGLAHPSFATVSNFTTVLRQAAVVSIVAVGMTYVIVGKEIDLSVGSNVALSMMLGAMVMTGPFGALAGAVTMMAVGGAVGFANGLMVTRLRIPSFLVTLGMLGIARGVALQVTGTRPVLIEGGAFWRTFAEGSLFGVENAILWSVGVVLVGHLFLAKTRFGNMLYAVGGNAVAAARAGINVQRVKLASFLWLGLLCGLAAAVLSARLHAARPNVAQGLELDVIAAVILGGTSLFGGVGTIVGTLFGSLIMAVVNNGLILLGLPSTMQLTVKGVIVIVAVAISGRGEDR
jgi:ribose/xylose/arabinose/galactoside ABC-type transport system permease subunit